MSTNINLKAPLDKAVRLATNTVINTQELQLEHLKDRSFELTKLLPVARNIHLADCFGTYHQDLL